MEKTFLQPILTLVQEQNMLLELVLPLSPESLKVAVYGLSTEGYKIASHISTKGIPVSIIDDSSGMAITLKPDIAKSYSSVTSFIQDETLLDFEPFDAAINNALFFLLQE